MAGKQTRTAPNVRVVSHHPWRQGLLLGVVVLVTLAGALGGYWLGQASGALDSTYLSAIERLNATNEDAIQRLQAQLVESELAREVDAAAARTLRDSIRGLKDELASLTEEVTFYKSLMAPSSVARGLQIADFELTAMDAPGRYTFHLLLTQVEARRDWVQGAATLVVHGRQPQTTGSDKATTIVERVLPLTEIVEGDSYPLKFRFRYFQDLTGVISLPAGFEPERIVVTAEKRGASPLDRSFDWTVAG
ncbi:MAG: DUF6776 family protein [Pseudomonadota bacterium]